MILGNIAITSKICTIHNRMFISILILSLYFTPTIIALCNHKKNTTAIATTNILLGWTIIGWIVSLIWSLTKD